MSKVFHILSLILCYLTLAHAVARPSPAPGGVATATNSPSPTKDYAPAAAAAAANPPARTQDITDSGLAALHANASPPRLAAVAAVTKNALPILATNLNLLSPLPSLHPTPTVPNNTQAKPPSKKKEKIKKTKSGKEKGKNGRVPGFKPGRLLQKNAVFTYYWMVQDQKSGFGNHGSRGGKLVQLANCSGKTIARVTKEFADALTVEGSGILENGLLVNSAGCECGRDFNCFNLLNNRKFPYGQSSMGTPLRPFTSIAANDLRAGTKIYVPQVRGWKLPGSDRVHNGCLLVDDRSTSFKSHHIDFFCVTEENYKRLDEKYHVTKVDIYEGGKPSPHYGFDPP
ncbi:uncharacterized protein VTP21DRAFT_7597 [Calcarisporiella thermophila]|uniref:uncharacterized protein n=1 Tax=Calcarisporiella thermophila TaxID=911321 RepID=UPI003743D14A